MLSLRCLMLLIGMAINNSDGQEAPLYQPDASVSIGISNRYMVILKQEYSVSKLLSVAARTASQADNIGSFVAIERLFENLFLGFSAEMDDQTLAMVRSYQEVEYVEQDVRLETQTTPSHLDRIDQRSSVLDGNPYSPLNNAEGVGVYIVDTGIKGDHEEVAGRVNFVPDESERCDFMQGQSAEVPLEQICGFHGTGMAALVGGKQYGVAKNVSLYDVRVLVGRCYSGDHFLSQAIHGLDMIVHHSVHPAVILMPFGTSQAYQSVSLTAATEVLHGLGFTQVAAAGEIGDACNNLFGNAQNVIKSARMAAMSSTDMYIVGSTGQCVDLFAPAEGVTTADTASPTSTRVVSGSSVSAAIVAGVAAVILADDPSLSPSEVRDRLLAGATMDTIAPISPMLPGTPNRMAYVGSDL